MLHRQPFPTALAAIGCALAGLGVLALASADRMIGSGLTGELAAATAARGSPPVAGSEAFWLSGHVTAGERRLSTLWTRPVALGDRLTIASTSGAARVLEVVELREISGALVKVGTANEPARLLMVTCADAADPTSLVRFIVEAEDREQAVPQAQPEKVL